MAEGVLAFGVERFESFLRRAEVFNKMLDHIDGAKRVCEIDLLLGHLQIGHAVSQPLANGVFCSP